jgi:mRNA interferase MazF
MTPSDSLPDPRRGEVWLIRFDPTKGAEVGKTRPAVVMNIPAVGRLPLRMVVPITGWKDNWATTPWLIHILPGKRNGLTKASAADAFQAKSLSIERFQKRLGVLKADEVEQIAAAICLCVGA